MHHVNKANDRKYAVISIDTEDAVDKGQYTFMIKSVEDNRNRETTPQNNKAHIQQNDNILLSGKKNIHYKSKNNNFKCMFPFCNFISQQSPKFVKTQLC